jgi:hypothetical protein
LTYSAGAPKSTLHVLMLSIFISSLVSERLTIFASLLTLIAALLRFHLTFHQGVLEYKITVYQAVIYRKVLPSEEIRLIKFGRAGWSTKTATVKVKRGVGFKVSYFNNPRIIEELEEFAEDNRIEIRKTRDYLILEKYYTQS